MHKSYGSVLLVLCHLGPFARFHVKLFCHKSTLIKSKSTYITSTYVVSFSNLCARRNLNKLHYSVMERWCNKVAVVSGASAGIGAACCKSLVSAGMVVVGLARRQERIVKLRDELPSQVRNNLHAFHCDITKEEDVNKVFEWTHKELGGCDVLVNNAGIIATALLSDRNNTKQIRDTIDTNLLGTVFCSREAFHSMATHKNGKGHIIIVNSVAGMQVPNLGPDLPSLNIYPATKFALRAMNEIYRQEFQRRKTQVRITVIKSSI